MNRDVFLSILAMDSYQRGYSPGIGGVTGDRIGTAAIRQDSSVLLDKNGNRVDIKVGFFSQSYQWGGETVISYRGTDFDPTNNFASGTALARRFPRPLIPNSSGI